MLELYYSKTCPYCKNVVDSFASTGIEFIPKDISIKENYDKLMELGKIAQVPFLVDTKNNKMMYESGDIITYVQNLNK